jgi:ATP-dependent RNA helicase SUPV3L1/SUV3
MIAALSAGQADVVMEGEKILWRGHPLARIAKGRALLNPTLTPAHVLDRLPATLRGELMAGLSAWLAHRWKPLAPLACGGGQSGAGKRFGPARTVDPHDRRGGMVDRAVSGVEKLTGPQRDVLRKLGVRIGPLDIFTRRWSRPRHWNCGNRHRANQASLPIRWPRY